MGRVLTYMKTCLLVSFTLLLSSMAAQAQSDDPPGRVARLNLADGAVSMLSQATGVDWVPAQVNYPLTTGDQIWTDFDSRAELHIGNAAIRLRDQTSATFTVLDDQTVQLQLVAGGLNIRVRHLYPDEVFEVDTPNLAFTIRQPGDYRIDVVGQQTKVIVWSGAGEVFGGGRDFPLRARDYATVTGYGELAYTLINAPSPDDFDRWAHDRDRRQDQQQARAASYVSEDTIGAEDLELYGSWSEVPDIGPVWTPRVRGGWAPYTIGHWAWIDPWGWTWIDDAPWGFAPFHYGRWAFVSGTWAWVPGPHQQRSVYAPALVAWYSRPGGAAWLALGPREVYVPTHRVSPAYFTRVNVNNTVVNRTVVTNVYNTTVINRTTVNNINYINQNAPGAMVGMSHSDMAAGRRSGIAAAQPTQVASAPVPAARPIMQPAPRGGAAPVARPPAAVVAPSRPVVVRNQAPAPTARPAFTSITGAPGPARMPVRAQVPVTTPPPSPSPSQQGAPPPSESGRRFPGPARESETIRPTPPPSQTTSQPRPSDFPDRPRRGVTPADNPTLPPNPPRTERPDRVTVPPPERIERPQPRIERPLERPVERPVERTERPVPVPERVIRPEVRVERPIDRPAPSPERVTRPEVRVERPIERPAPSPERVTPPEVRVERPIDRPAPSPERVTRPEVRVERPVEHMPPPPAPRQEARPEPRREEPKREEKKEEKKDEKKKS